LWDSLHCWKFILCFQVKHIKKSKQCTITTTTTTTHLILAYCRLLLCESRTYCFFTLVQPAALIPKHNHWISHYKSPQPVHLIHLNIIRNGLLRYDVSTKLHGITPQKAINLALRTSTLSYQLSSSYKTFPRKKSHVLFCSVWAIIHTHHKTAAPTHLEPEGPVVLADKILSLQVHGIYEGWICNSVIIHILQPAVTKTWDLLYPQLLWTPALVRYV